MIAFHISGFTSKYFLLQVAEMATLAPSKERGIYTEFKGQGNSSCSRTIALLYPC